MPSERLDAEQLAANWAKVQPQVAGYISSLVRDYHDADDLVQTVAAIVVRKRDEYDPQKAFVGWVLSIARLEVLNFRRKAARDRHQFSEDVVELISDTYERVTTNHSSRREALLACLKRLKDRARKAIGLRYSDGLMPAEIGERMGITTNAATVMIHRARKSLRECIENRLSSAESGS